MIVGLSMEQGYQRIVCQYPNSKIRLTKTCYPYGTKFCGLVATTSTSPDMTTVFYSWLNGRFIEMQSNFRRKKLHRTNEGSNSLGGTVSNRHDDLSIFTSIAPLLLDWSNKTS